MELHILRPDEELLLIDFNKVTTTRLKITDVHKNFCTLHVNQLAQTMTIDKPVYFGSYENTYKVVLIKVTGNNKKQEAYLGVTAASHIDIVQPTGERA